MKPDKGPCHPHSAQKGPADRIKERVGYTDEGQHRVATRRCPRPPTPSAHRLRSPRMVAEPQTACCSGPGNRGHARPPTLAHHESAGTTAHDLGIWARRGRAPGKHAWRQPSSARFSKVARAAPSLVWHHCLRQLNHRPEPLRWSGPPPLHGNARIGLGRGGESLGEDSAAPFLKWGIRLRRIRSKGCLAP